MTPTEQVNPTDVRFHLKDKKKTVDISAVKIDKLKSGDERIEDYTT